MSDEEKQAMEYIRDTQICDGYKGQVYAVTLVNLIEKQSKEIEELKDFIVKLQATKDRLDSYDKENTLEIEKLKKEIDERTSLREKNIDKKWKDKSKNRRSRRWSF